MREIRDLAITPRPHGCAKIVGAQDSYRIRVGDWRVIYLIVEEKQRRLVLVSRVKRRNERTY